MKTYQVSNLPDRCRFIIPTQRDTMRRLEIVKVTECSTLITGQKRDSINDSWNTFRDYIANSVTVVIDDSLLPDEIVEIAREKNEEISDVQKVKGTKGKKRTEVNLIITDAPFTIKEISIASSVSPALGYLRVMEMVNAGTVKMVSEGGFAKGTRGKVPAQFQKI